MKLLNKRTGGAFPLCKFLILLILTCCVLTACLTTDESAQAYTPAPAPVPTEPANVTEISFPVDLSRMPVVNNDNTVTFDKATNTFTVKKDYLEQAGLNLWLGQDISELNILRIKYKALGDAGFCLFTEYANDNLDDYDNPWFDRNTYCPSYLTEMVIPLKNGMRKLNSIGFFSMNCVKDEKFIIESVTLEKVSNPVKTNIWASNEPPVIDTATKVTMNEKLTAWDFVPQLGVGYHYQQFLANDPSMDYGLDAYLLWDFPKPSKEGIKFIKEKGFTTVRLQNAPGAYMLDERYTIDPGYLKALKQCVDWLIEEGLYVILAGPRDDHLQQAQWQGKIGKDVHYACYNVSEKDKAQSKAFLKAVWLQYAQAFNNSYDEHLIFETMDEPAAIFHEHAWNPDENCSTCKKNFEIINEYNQLIVDTIRSTGGNNANRFIMVEGLTGNRYWLLAHKRFKLPEDSAKNKIIPAVHNYPMPAGRTLYTDGLKKFFITDCFDALDEYFFNKKIPVYFSEVGHPRTIPILERIKCIKDFMAEVRKPNRSCAVSLFDCFNRFEGGTAYDQYNSEWVETEYVDSLLYAAKGKQYLLSSVFTKENEITVESIVGKNLLSEPFNPNNWKAWYEINPNILVRSVPANYKLEIQIEKTGSKPILQVSFHDFKNKSTDISTRNDVKVTGAVKGFCFEVKSETVTITVNDKLAAEFEDAENLYFGGQDIIIKSVKVVE